MRALAEIRADRARTLEHLIELDREEAAFFAARNADIIAAFKAGEIVNAIAARLGLTPNVVYGVLHRGGQKARKRATPISHLPAPQQRAYHKAVAHGIGPAVARQIAMTVSA